MVSTNSHRPLSVGGLGEFVAFAEYVGPQLVKIGKVSDLMKQVGQTEVIKAAVEFQGVTTTGGEIKVKSGGGRKGIGPPIKKVSVQDMIDEIRSRFNISDEEALYIKQVTDEKADDPRIRATVAVHRENRVYLDGAYIPHLDSFFLIREWKFVPPSGRYHPVSG